MGAGLGQVEAISTEAVKVMTAEFSPPENWLIEQLRFDRTSRAARAASLALPSSLDWNQVIATAQWHGLAGLLLASDTADAMPAEARAQLEEIAFETRTCNAAHRLGLEEWLNRFDAAGIPTIILKGIAVTALVYGRSSLRWMQDVDVLVRREDFGRAGELLRAAGFSPCRELGGATEPTLRTQTHWINPTPPGGALDLHWHLIDSGYYAHHVPIKWFWDHTVSVPFLGREMRVLAPEAQLLHLTAHLELHHASVSLLALYDIAALIHKFSSAMDWELLLNTAARFEWGQSLRHTVQRAETLFGVSLPNGVAARLEHLPPTWHERLARVLATPAAHPAVFLFDGWEQPGVRGKVRYWWRSLFPSAEFMQERDAGGRQGCPALRYLLRLARGMYRIPRALFSGVAQLLHPAEAKRG